jgi:hypothetical protein
MANIKISQLPSLATLAGTTVFPTVDTGTNYKLTTTVLQNYVRNNLPEVTTFTGTIVGTTLTVTGITGGGKIAWEQAVEGVGLDPDTFIDYQLTGTSGGNGTYKITPSQNIGPISMSVAAVYIDSSLKLGVNHCLYQKDAHDATLYNFIIGIQNTEATIHIGDINTNGVCITNDKEYKVHSALNVGTYMAVAKVDTGDNVILSSGNAATTKIRVGGDTAVGGYALKFNNGGQALMPVGLRIGDNVNSSIFGAPLEVGSVLAGNANNQSNPGGIALPTYRGTATTIANDEWGSYIYGSRYRGTANAPLAVKPDDWLMEFGATAFDGHGGNGGGGEMAFRVDGAVTASANPSRWELYVTPAGTNSQALGLKVDSSLATTLYGSIIGTATQDVFNTVSTTVNAFGAATTINIAGSGSTTTVLGALKVNDVRDTVYTGGPTTGTITPNAANGCVQTITLTGSITLNAFASPQTGQSITMIITQPASGGPYTLTSSMKFAGGLKTLSTTASAVDMLTITYTGSVYYARLVTGFA